MTEFETTLKQRCIGLIKTAQDNGIVGMSWDCFVQNVSTHGLAFLDGAPKGTNAPFAFRETLKEVYPQTYKAFITE